jgi:hypothetical protein
VPDARWREAPEVRVIANRLIPLYHDHLVGYEDEIRYLFRDVAQRTRGAVVWAKAHLVSGMTAYFAQGTSDSFADPEMEPNLFVMEVALPIWQDLTDRQKDALVDHELIHFAIEENELLGPIRTIRPHDVEEFTAIASRYGAWRPALERFADALRLHELDPTPVSPPPARKPDPVAAALAKIRAGEDVSPFLDDLNK